MAKTQVQADGLSCTTWFQQGDSEEKEKIMKQDKAWKAYIDVLHANSKNSKLSPYSLTSGIPDEVARFETALENQLETYEKCRQKDAETARQLRSRVQASVLPAIWTLWIWRHQGVLQSLVLPGLRMRPLSI